MCTIILKNETDNYKHIKSGKLTVYKYYYLVRIAVDGRKCLLSLYAKNYLNGDEIYDPKFGGIIYGPGEITSSRKPNEKVSWDCWNQSRIGAGIHTYLQDHSWQILEHALGLIEPPPNLVKVELDANIEDMIGCNTREAVFAKVILTEYQWQKIITLTEYQWKKLSIKNNEI